MKLAHAVVAAAVVAAVAALARAGDGRSVEERLASLEGQVSRLTTTVTAHETRIAQLGGAGGSTPLPLVPSTPPAMSETPPPPPTATPTPESRTVYVTKSGTKYHGAGCSYLRTSGTPMSLADALARGFTPCSRCGGR
ncbi:MAG: hypothetical protein IT460_06935 [Planctomycetes bacterium]|nr:hypothetical protein [Planctomycetota bacterium]